MPHIMTFKLKAGSGVYATLECTEEPDASKSYCRSPYPEVCAIVFAFESDPASAIQEYSSLEIELRRVSIAVLAMADGEFAWDLAVIQPTDTAQKLRRMAKREPLPYRAILTDAADELEQANEILQAHATALPSMVAELHTLRPIRAAAEGLSDVLLHSRDRASGYMNAPPFKRNPFPSASRAFERAAGLARDLADGKLNAVELDRLAHFNEDGKCTAYDYEKRSAPTPKELDPTQTEEH